MDVEKWASPAYNVIRHYVRKKCGQIKEAPCGWCYSERTAHYGGKGLLEDVKEINRYWGGGENEWWQEFLV